jgi:hypothetical protein
MKNWIIIISAIFVVPLIMSCTGEKVPEDLELQLVPAKGYEGPAKGTVVIKNGSDVSLDITGLTPGEVYTAFFINVKSKMFEGIGDEPYVLSVDQNGAVKSDLKIKKDIYKRFIRLGVFLNPGKQPIKNPLGVKAALGELVKKETPKMVLEGKLR